MPADIADNDQLNVLYSGSIQRALVYKLVQLETNGSFRPKESITRGDAAVQVYNALEYLNAHPAPTLQ